MPLCRAAPDDLQEQLLDIMHQQDSNLQQISQLLRNTGHSGEKLGQQQFFLRQLLLHLQLLRQLRQLKSYGGKTLAQCCSALPGLQERDLGNCKVPDAKPAQSVVPGRAFFALNASAVSMRQIGAYVSATADLQALTPFDAVRERQALRECQRSLAEFKAQTDRTRQVSERLSQLKMENAALREQAFACNEQLQGEESAQLLKIEALAKQCEALRLEKREAARDTSVVQRQVDECLKRIDAQVGAERIAVDYQHVKERLAAAESELQSRCRELAELKKDAVSVTEYNQMKQSMLAKFEAFRAAAASAEKMNQNEIYKEYLALLQKINTPAVI